jgi:hypothetical protein
LKASSTDDALGAEIVASTSDWLKLRKVHNVHDKVDVAIRALSRTWVADHGGNAAVVALGGELVGRCGTAGHAGGVLQEIGEEEGIVGDREADTLCTVITVPHTGYAMRVAVPAHGLIIRIGSIDFQLVLPFRTQTRTDCGIRPLVVIIGAKRAVKICWSKALHAAIVAKHTQIGHLSIEI